ncbi:MAG: pyridoxamine 5'-phosphate oxidase family protein [Candidatus Thorarchaeota archaeon]
MREMRRKEKAITDRGQLVHILRSAKYVTIAMSLENEPYLVTLSHGYDESKNCIYFHCAQEGKKIDILKRNNLVWGQALLDYGYAHGKCDHHFATTQFRGRVTFVTDLEEKRYALTIMVNQLEENPQIVISEQFNDSSIRKVNIGRIDIDYLSGKHARDVIISL